MPKLLGSLQIKGFQAKELPCWKALLSERGALPKHLKYSCIAFPGAGSAVQPESASHSHEPELRTDLKHLWRERQLTFPTAYSSVQFFKHTISNTAQNKGASSQAAWAPKHTRLPLKCHCPAWKAALQKCPNLKCPTQQDTRQSPFKSWLSSVIYQKCRSSSPPSPKIPHL